ncbi:MAG: VaFE repeat-containing surface-anchored protein, partial [Clostridiales bacterium]|nr:VaFE repeat-containing surface-anchored protein [Clostridiales bacterium]
MTARTKVRVLVAQVLIWEVTEGERDADFEYIGSGSGDPVKSMYYFQDYTSSEGTYYSAEYLQSYYEETYDKWVSQIQYELRIKNAIPGFASTSKSTAKSNAYELAYDSSTDAYTAALADKNQVTTLYDNNIVYGNSALSSTTTTGTTYHLNVTSTAEISEEDPALITMTSDREISTGSVTGWIPSDDDLQTCVTIGSPSTTTRTCYAYVYTEDTGGYIEITKTSSDTDATDGNSNYSLEGAVYGVYSDSACTDKVTSITIGSDGTGKSDLINKGTYYLKETSRPSDGSYTLSSTVYGPYEVGGGLVTLADTSDTPVYGKITVNKSTADSSTTSGNSNYSLEGAKYGIYTDSDCTTKVATITTNSSGVAVSGELPLGTYYVKETEASKGFTVDSKVCEVKVIADGTSTVITKSVNSVETPEYGYLGVLKKSGNTELTEGNTDCYSLEGAVYYVYTDEKCTTKAEYPDGSDKSGYVTLTTDSNGKAVSGKVAMGTYYLKEYSASMGYELDEDGIYKVVVDSDNTTVTNAEIKTVYEEPGNDPIVIFLNKENNEGGTLYQYSLAGAQFTINYYNGLYTKSALPSEATRTWVIEVKEVNGIYQAVLDDSYKVGGDSFYYDEYGSIIVPYGTVTIQETKAADEYTLEGGYIVDSSGNKITDMSTALYVHQITEDTNISLTGYNQYTIYNAIKRADFDLNKKDEETSEPMSVPFKITNDETGESHIFYTDANGYYSSSSSYILRSTDTNGGEAGDGLWFGNGNIIDSEGALPLGTYTVEELSCDANAGKKLVSFSITVDENAETANMGTFENADISLGTTVQDEDTKSHYSVADSEVCLTDTAKYTGLNKGDTYTITGYLMNKATGEAITDSSGNKITSTKTFTAPADDGYVEVEFIFDASDLVGEEIVVFEYVYLNGELVVSHEDLDDEGQAIEFPGIQTQAVDSDTSTNLTNADESITIVDTVAYANLKVGKTYTLSGTLMNKETGEAAVDADGNTITASTTFKATSENGTVDVTFEFNGSNLAGETLVAFEDLKDSNMTWATHSDINDEDQTVYVPKIGTTAADSDTEMQNSAVSETVTIIDTVAYENVVVGKEYTVSGVLMDKSTGEELIVNDQTVTAETSFIAEETSGTVELEFTFDSSALAGTTIVVFEDLYYNGVEIASHADINDEGQTIYIPDVHTTAIDEESQTHNAMADEEVTIVDTVAYSNLIVG